MAAVPDVTKPVRRRRALVVDDNHDAAEVLARMLQAMGCDATFITNSVLAMAEVLNREPEIVFLDLEMPSSFTLFWKSYSPARPNRSNPARRTSTSAIDGGASYSRA
jgi:CheY-like chemotaxis protein